MTNPPPQPARRLSEQFDDPELVDAIFDYVVELLPALAGSEKRIKSALRDRFAGERAYVRKRPNRDRIAAQVLSLFNGRNATEVARKLNISRATVYRMLKQAGPSQPAAK